jgi:large subunit ribosomal protein L17
MRHGKKFNHLGRQSSHRGAMLANMACSLIESKRINTTVAKAKALRVYVEPLLTKAKDDSTHSRRTVFAYLKSKEAVSILFRDVAPKIADRPGGYTRIIKTGNRLGDNADMAMIELVDYNEIYTNDKKATKAKTRRSRRGGASAAKETAPAAPKAEETVEVAAAVEETTNEVVAETAPETNVEETKQAETDQENNEEKKEE